MSPPVIVNLKVCVGEDFRQAYVAAAGVDVSDWNTWALGADMYLDGNLIASCTESAGTIVRTATGAFYFWFKKAVTATWTVGSKCSLIVWRSDENENVPLMKGTVTIEFGRAA
jgi:hypothetical protein